MSCFLVSVRCPLWLSRSAFSFAARSMIVASIAPASPPLAGLLVCHTAGVSSREDVFEIAVALHAAAARTR